MPTRAEVRAVFQQLKPLCVKLMELTTERCIAATPYTDQSSRAAPAAISHSLTATLQQLHSTIQAQPRLALLHSLDYLLFPLTSLLSQPIAAVSGSESAYPARSHLSFVSARLVLSVAPCGASHLTNAVR